MLAHALDQFDRSEKIDRYVLMAPHDRVNEFRNVVGTGERQKCINVFPGGKSRRDSVRLGLENLEDYSPERVFVHDTARPIVPEPVFERLSGRFDSGNCTGVVPALPVNDTVKVVKSVDSRLSVQETLDRNRLRRIQTPQLFKFDVLATIHAQWDVSKSVTDDAMMLEEEGYSIAVVDGSARSRKITYRDDLYILETLLNKGTDGHDRS